MVRVESTQVESLAALGVDTFCGLGWCDMVTELNSDTGGPTGWLVLQMPSDPCMLLILTAATAILTKVAILSF